MKTKISFTKSALNELPIPNFGSRLTFYDIKIPGLCIRVTASGTKTFSLRKRAGHKIERITLGRYPQMSIEQARKKALSALGQISEGKSPNDVKRAIRDEIIFSKLFEQFLERHAKVYNKSWKQYEAQYNRYLKHWRSKPLSTITRREIESLHRRIGEDNGKVCANRLLALLHTVFEKAIEWGWEGRNPARKIKKYREKTRDRFLQPDELPRFFNALAEVSNPTARDYILMSLLTGARRSNVMAMRWCEINFCTKEWKIPETKNGESHRVPLVDQAITILEDRRKNSDSMFVFPGNGKTGHIVEPKNTWKQVCEKAELENLRLHDLRRSLGSWQAATGASLSVIGKTLAHKNVSTTAIYARLNIDPVRDSMSKAVTAMYHLDMPSAASQKITSIHTEDG